MVTGIYGFDTFARADEPTSSTTLADHARNAYFGQTNMDFVARY